MVALPAGAPATRRLRRGARGRYTAPPQLFPLLLPGSTDHADGPLLVERDSDGTYLVRERATSRMMARTNDPATLQRLLATMTGSNETEA